MDFFTQLEISQPSPHFQQNDPHKMMEISPFHGIFDLQYESKNFSYLNEFDDLENFNFDFNLPHLDEHFEVDQNPLKMLPPEPEPEPEPEPSLKTESANGNVTVVKKEFEEDNEEEMAVPALASWEKKKKRSSNAALEFEEIKNHFDVPINEAAKKMNVGLTHLKKRCRELKITRWPHRKLKSLNLLINTLKELGLGNEVVMLEKQTEMMEKVPSMDLNQETKKLRQECFKANYKRRRLITLRH